MKKRLGLAAVMAIASLQAAQAETGWILDIMPGSVLASFEGQDFDARGEGEQEEISLVSSMPSIAGGVRFENANGYVDLKGGAGVVLNSRLSAYTLYGLAEAYWEVKRSMMWGPTSAWPGIPIPSGGATATSRWTARPAGWPA